MPSEAIYSKTFRISPPEKQRISGLVCDSVTSKPIELANISLFSAADSQFVNGTISGIDGYFILDIPVHGKYYTIITFVGYKSKIIDINLSITDTVLYLDTIALNPGSVSLSEVKITAEKERMIFENDRIIVNIDKKILGLGGSAIDILENTPMVRVDFNGSVSLQGRKGTVIYIDGISTRDMGTSQQDILRSIPAEDIEKLELITEPNIEYRSDAENGIINIVLKKNNPSKYNGVLALSANTNNAIISSANLSYRTKKINLRGGLNSNYSKTNTGETLLREITLNNIISKQEQSKENNNKSWNNRLNLNAFYTINKNHNISSSLAYTKVDRDLAGSVKNTFYDAANYVTDHYQSGNDINTDSWFWNYVLAYAGNFPGGYRLKTSVSIVNNFMESNSDIQQELAGTTAQEFSKKQNYSGNGNQSYLVKAYYKNPFTKASVLDIYYEGSFKKLDMANDYFVINGSVKSENLDYKSKQSFNEQNQELNFAYSDKLWDLNYEISFMIEALSIENSEFISKEEYSYNYFTYFPGILVKKQLGKGQHVTFSFGKRISYPRNKQLNPHIDYSDSTNIIVGNLKLKPSETYSYNASYNIALKNTFVQTSIHFRKKFDGIESYSTLLSKDVSLTTYKNISGKNTYSMDAMCEQTINDWWRFSVDANIYKSEYTNVENARNIVSWSGSLSSQILLDKLSFQMNFLYSAPSITAQEKTNDNYYLNIAAKTSLFEKKLMIYAKIQDLFNWSKNNSDYTGTNFYAISSTHQTTRIIELGLFYYFQPSEENDQDLDNAEEDLDDF